MAADRTGAVIALKQLDLAKSRVLDTPPALRERLALAMMADTCRAVAAVADVTLVISDARGLHARLGAPSGVEVVADPGTGLNPAYARGARRLADAGCTRILACVADLAALTPDAVEAVLTLAGDDPRAFVRDHTGRGTTMLVARAVDLDPRFENGSADRHLDSGAAEIADAPAAARLDVDRIGDLPAAAALGLGPQTGRLWSGAGLAAHDTAVVGGPTQDGWWAVRSSGARLPIPASALAPELRTLQATQRVHVALDDERVTLAWL